MDKEPVREKTEQEAFQAAATKVSLVSMVTNVILTLLKLAAGIIARSGAMVSGVLALVGGTIGVNAVRDIISGRAGEMEAPGMLALAAAAVSIVTKEILFWYTRGYAKRYRSTALHAEAWHQRSDALSSIGALIGIAGARMGVPVMEPIASVIIALFILRVAVRIFKDATDQMVDRSYGEEEENAFRATALEVPGVLGVELLRTRMFGNRVYVDLEIAADPELTLAAAHEIAEQVHDAIEQTYPEVKHIMVHVNPAGEHAGK